MMKLLMFLIYLMMQNLKFMIYPRKFKKNTQTAEDLVIQAKQKIEEISKREGLSGIASGFMKLIN